MNIAYFDCFSGISGDMILGALIDAGLPFRRLKTELTKVSLRHYKISAQKVLKHGISATSLKVSTKPNETLSLPQMKSLIKKSKLINPIKKTALKILQRLGAVEAKVHGERTSSTIHLHELSSIDTLIDIVGAVIGLSLLDINKVYVSPMPFNYGWVKFHYPSFESASHLQTTHHKVHSKIPVPAPATVELIKGFPIFYSNISEELVTPTGAVIITTLAQPAYQLPLIRVLQTGYGAGEKELTTQPNLLRVIIGKPFLKDEDYPDHLEQPKPGLTTETAWVMEANIDDTSPEILGYLYDKLLEAGALDVFIVPIQMKKSRPGLLLRVLADTKTLEHLASIIFSETTTLGLRQYPVRRVKLEREEILVKTSYGKVKVKIGRFKGKIKTISPEYESCQKIARAQGLPLKQVFEEVHHAATRALKDKRKFR